MITGLWSIFAFFREHWQLIAPAVPVVGILWGIGWFSRDWRFIAAGICVILMLIYSGWFFNSGYTAREEELKREHARILAERQRTIEELTVADAERAKADAARIRELEEQIAKTPPNDKECFDEDTSKRVGSVK